MNDTDGTVSVNEQEMPRADRLHGLLEFSIERATDGILWVEAGGSIFFANQTLCDSLGYAREELTSMQVADIDPHFANVERRAAVWDELRATGKSRFETEQLTRDGRLIPVEIRANYIVFEGVEYTCSFVTDLSERRHLEETMRLARFSVDNAADAVFWIAADASLFYANEAACRTLDYTRDELLRMSIPDLNPNFDREVWEAHWERVKREGSLTFESQHRAKDGRLIPVEINANYMACKDKAFICGFIRDISGRKRTEETLLATRQRFMDLVNTTEGVVWEADARTFRFTFVSEQAVRMFGYPLESWSEDGFWASRVHPHDRDEAVRYCMERTRRLETHAFDYRFICADGRVRWVHDVVSVVAEDGQPSLLRGILLDVTERHGAEERLRFLAGVFEHASEGIMVTDSTPAILDVNPAFTAITGYSRDEVLGRSPGLLSSGEHRVDFYAAMNEALARDGVWRGEMWSRHKDGSLFPELRSVSAVRSGGGEVSHYVSVFADISQIKEHQSRLEAMAHYDALTHLPNRVLLADRLAQAIAHAARNGRLLAVCYMDLDDFKPVNDEFGHEAGDQLLIELAERLRDALRGDDTIARLGGDEFVLLLGDLDDLDACEQALERLLATVARPVRLLGDNIVTVHASIGVTLFPRDSSDADTLLRHADQALYIAKQSGRKRYHLFDLEHDRRARAHQEILHRVEVGLAEGEFRLHYQPKVNMRTGKVVGVEALVRWQHPERGLLSPGEFLPQVEGTSVAPVLGEWVIGEALSQMDSWWRLGLPLAVSINIAVGHLVKPGFAAALAARLEQLPGIPPDQIELEILETAALEDIALVSSVIQDCRRLGVHFSLDDFGAGYSSLTLLRRLPADVLKIDQSFVRDMLKDPDDFVIVDGVIGLARAFSRSVIAEGVESAEHGVLLMQLGCELVQGYGIARPMPAERLVLWLGEYEPDPLWAQWHDEIWSREEMPILVAAMDIHHDVGQILRVLEQDSAPAFAAVPPVFSSYDDWCELHRLEQHCSRPGFDRIEAAYCGLSETITDVSDAKLAGLAQRLIAARDELLAAMSSMSRTLDMTYLDSGPTSERLF